MLVGGTAIEVIAAEVFVHRPVLEHVVDGGKDGGGDGHDRLLGAAPGFDAVELGLQVAVFLFYRRPGALHQRGFEPGSTLAQAIGSTLAGTLVVARTYASPRDEMCVEGNRLMSMPISETMTLAPRFLMPGIDIISSTAVRKGPRFASTCASSVAIAALRASI